MRHITLTALTLATVASSLVFISCKKDKEDPKPKTKTELLTTKNWRLSAVTFVTGTTTTDTYALLNTCEKDYFVKFNTNKSLLFDEGPAKCNPTSPQSTTGTWDLTVNDTKLTVRASPTASARLYDVVEISESTIRVTQPANFRGVTGTETRTWTAF